MTCRNCGAKCRCMNSRETGAKRDRQYRCMQCGEILHTVEIVREEYREMWANALKGRIERNGN